MHASCIVSLLGPFRPIRASHNFILRTKAHRRDLSFNCFGLLGQSMCHAISCLGLRPIYIVLINACFMLRLLSPLGQFCEFYHLMLGAKARLHDHICFGPLDHLMCHAILYLGLRPTVFIFHLLLGPIRVGKPSWSHLG